ncbi:MAG TPA: hypothetical protein VFG23_06890 [Polyangia bacterium]|nr:hypothetical protein [Polyangia bacterium]
MRVGLRTALSRALLLSPWLVAAVGCNSTPAEPQNPAWADVAPIFRGECDSCHGWTAPTTGAGYRFDFFDATEGVCGDAALAMESGVVLAGSPLAGPQIQTDLLVQKGARWPRMPPQPSPALPDWERDTLERWAAQPIKGPSPPGNRAPNISIAGYPATADDQLSFTAIIDDPDGDSTIGVIEVNGLAFLMGRPGSFDVQFDSSIWPAGPQDVSAVLCDGWSSATIALGSVQIRH